MRVNSTRVWIGGVAGGVVWTLWSIFINLRLGNARYEAMQAAGIFLKQPRYPFFMASWTIMLFVMAILMAYLYAWTRNTLGAGPRTALKIGMIVGFFAGFPDNFGQATWSAAPRVFPLAWMLEMWVGCILATLVAGYIYKE